MPRRPTVLVVDDEPDIVNFLGRVFKGEYNVLQSTDALEALEILKKERVDVIVTDQKMPGMSGTQLLEASLEIDPKIVKIILSAYTDTADILSAINVCRINHYIVKPVEVEKLRNTVAKAIELVHESVRYD